MSSSLSSAYGTIDVNSMVAQLMQVERNPQILLQNRQLKISTKASALESIAADVGAVKSAASLLDASSEWEPLKTTSSSSAVSTSATTGAITGSLEFKITQLASKQKLYSSSTVASTSTKVTGASRFLIAAGMGSMGFGTVKGDGALALGNHTVVVTQASAAATKTGDTALQTPTVIDSSNNELDIFVGGVSYTLNLASGEYEGPNDVADAVNTAIAAMGPGGPNLSASVDGNGKLLLTTGREGSAATIQVVGGSAASALGLSTDASAIAGTDAKVKVDGTETVLTNVGAGSTVHLAAPTGGLQVALTGGIRTGTSTVSNVDLGDGSLAAAVNAINGAGSSVAATAVKVGTNAYRLQIESKQTGVAGRMNVDLSAFDGVSGFSTLAAGNDAAIQVQGSDPYTVTSSSNTFADVMPGVTFTLNNPTSETITLQANRDADTLATRVDNLVKALNTTFADIKVKSAYNVTAKSGGALVGDSSTRNLRSQLSLALTSPVEGGSITMANSVGISVSRDGTLSFDKAKFQKAYEADPAGVQRLFFGNDVDNPGIAQRLIKTADAAIDPTKGYLTTSATQSRSTADGIGKQIDAFEKRMTIRETAMKAQWNAINVALERLSQQNSSLASQLAGLSSSDE